MKNDPRAEIKISFISKVAWQTLLMSHSCVHMKYERGKIYSFREMINWHSNQRLYPELILLLFSKGEKRDSVSTKKYVVRLSESEIRKCTRRVQIDDLREPFTVF